MISALTDSHFDTGLGLEGTHAVITGAAGQIGSVLVEVGGYLHEIHG